MPLPQEENRRLSKTRQALAWSIVVLVLTQALIAGRSNRLFGSWDIAIHGVLGNIVFLAAVALFVVVAVARPGRLPLGATLALVVVLVVQTGLGYAGRDSIDASAWHIPNGVLAFGLAVWNVTLASAGLRAPVGG